MKPGRLPRLGAGGLVVSLWVSVALGAAEPLQFVVDGQRIIFTNTPGGANARPVPGLAQESRPGVGRRAMPATVYDPYIERVAAEHGLSADLIKAVALVESGFNARAVSPKGAQGLMQLMPATAERYGVRDALDPLENLRAGTAHLRDLLDEFHGDLTLALAAYNAGSGAVRRHGGVPAYKETRDYVQRVRERLDRPVRRRAPGPATPGDVRMERLGDGSVRLAN